MLEKTLLFYNLNLHLFTLWPAGWATLFWVQTQMKNNPCLHLVGTELNILWFLSPPQNHKCSSGSKYIFFSENDLFFFYWSLNTLLFLLFAKFWRCLIYRIKLSVTVTQWSFSGKYHKVWILHEYEEPSFSEGMHGPDAFHARDYNQDHRMMSREELTTVWITVVFKTITTHHFSHYCKG